MLFILIIIVFIFIFFIAVFGDYNAKEIERDYVKFNDITSSK